MNETNRTAQMRLNPTFPSIRQLAERERTLIPYPKPIGRFARKRKFKPRDPQKYIPKRPLLETLIGSIEATKCKTLENFTGGDTQ